MSTTEGTATNSAPPAPEATGEAPAAPFTLLQLQGWWIAAGCEKEGKYYPSAANYENNWWLTITEDQVKADMANYKAKADAGEATAEAVNALIISCDVTMRTLNEPYVRPSDHRPRRTLLLSIQIAFSVSK